MKKFFTLFAVAILFIVFQGKSQNCSADFTYGYASNSPSTIYFTPVFYGDSLNTTHLWYFGDGTSSYAPNPTHVYPSVNATYTVMHVVTHIFQGGVICRDSVYKVVTIQAAGTCTLTPNFSFQIDTSNNRTVYFQNSSTPYNYSDSVQWLFGDSTVGVGPNTSHTYANAGTYQVTMKIWQRVNGQIGNCVKTITKVVTVGSNTTGCNLAANFSFQMASANNFYFFNNTAGYQTGDSVRWTFGDGTSSMQYNAQHIYNTPGTYQVCLRVKRATPPTMAPCVSEICKTIIVQSACNLIVGFQATAVTGSTNTFQFQNSSTPVSPNDSITWRFGDGSFAFVMNPTHTYANPGNYSVCLTIQKRDSAGMPTNCIRTYCDSIQVAGVVCNMTASFTSAPDSSASNTLKFFNGTTGLQPTDSVFWSFGDSTYSSLSSPSHTYPAPGSYRVCLRMARPMPAGTAPCVKEICKWVTIQAPCTLQPNFTWTADSTNPNKISFQNNSNSGSTTQYYNTWTFGDGTSGSELNPTHIYPAAGTYVVCLRVFSSNNCNRTYCDTIVVDSGGCYIRSDFYKFNSNTSTLTANFRPAVIDSNWSYSWSFGDGNVSNAISPSHKYAYSDSFNVCLTVNASPNCSNTSCKWIYVAPPINCDSVKVTVTLTRDTYTFNRYSFRYSSNTSAISTIWTVKNLQYGTTDTLRSSFATYQFRDTGNFRVCLRAVYRDSCVKEICRTIYIPPFSCDSVNLDIAYQRDRYNYSKYYFRAVSNYYPKNQLWAITQLNGYRTDTLRWSNPYYYFQDTGVYSVCLKAHYNDSCTKSTCDTISVTQLSAPPNTCYLQVFPNPATSYINMTVYLSQSQNMNISIYNSMNVLVKQRYIWGQPGQNYISEYIGNLMPGMYYVRVMYGNNVCSAMFSKL
jgi:PKD repeat protein